MSDSQDPNGKSLGMGGEAVESVHAAQQEAAGQPPAASQASQQNAAATGTAHGDESGSEPLTDRDAQHVPGYGGMLGAARTSADTREAADPTGDPNAGDRAKPPA